MGKRDIANLFSETSSDVDILTDPESFVLSPCRKRNIEDFWGSMCSGLDHFRNLFYLRMKDEVDKSIYDHHITNTESIHRHLSRIFETLMDNLSIILAQRYKLLESIGSGATSEVFLAEDLENDEFVALKILFIPKAGIACTNETRQHMFSKHLQKIQTEIKAMKAINHHNVVKLKEITDFQDSRKKGPDSLVWVSVLSLEACNKGELFDYVALSGGFPLPVVRHLTYQILQALKACHSRDIVHRDVKLENLLLDDDFCVKLSDFGLAANGEDEDITCLNSHCGTKGYMAPEVLQLMNYEGRKADIWSFGCVLFILFIGYPPFESASEIDPFFKLLELNQEKFWSTHQQHVTSVIPTEFKTIVSKILKVEPNLRPSADQLLSDPFFEGNSMPDEEYTQEMKRRFSMKQKNINNL